MNSIILHICAFGGKYFVFGVSAFFLTLTKKNVGSNYEIFKHTRRLSPIIPD